MKELLEKILGQIKKTPEGVRAYEDLWLHHPPQEVCSFHTL